MEQHYFLPLHFSIFLLIVSSILLLWCFLSQSKGGSGGSTSLAARALLFRLLFARGYFPDIRSALHRLRERHGPVITVGFGPMSVTWVMDPRVAHRALVQEGAVFNDRRPVNEGSIFVMSYSGWRLVGGARGRLWGVLRRNLLSRALRRSNLRAFAGRRRLAAEQLVAELRATRQEEEEVLPFAAIFERAFTGLMLTMCFGEHLNVAFARPGAETNPTVPLGVKLSLFTGMPDLIRLVFWRRWRGFLQGRRRFEGTVLPFLRARRERAALEQRGEDAVCYADTLLELEVPEGEEGASCRKLSDKEIANLCLEFMALGVESTVCAVEWVMANLVVHPRVQRRLYEYIVAVAPLDREILEEDLANMPYLRAVIMETLRLHPPITIPLPRAATKRARIDGHTVEKGRMILFDLVDVGRDGAIWEEPREFKPERFLEGGEGEGVDLTGSREIKMAPFGMGRRLCPAMDLSMLHLELFVATLVRGFQWEAADHHGDGRANVDMTARIDIIGAMKSPLRARASPRQ